MNVSGALRSHCGYRCSSTGGSMDRRSFPVGWPAKSGVLQSLSGWNRPVAEYRYEHDGGPG